MKSLTAVVGLVLLVGGFTYYHARSQDTSGLRLSGVVAANEVIIAAKIDGRIQRLLVNEGSWVKRDDVIAQLERDEIEPERQRQQAAVQQQEARLSQGREQLHLDRERVRTQLAGAQANLQLAVSQREESRAELGQLQRDFERSSGLVSQGLLARQEAEKVETSLRVAEARIRSLDDRVRVAQADVEVAKANERQAAVSAQDVEQLRAQLDQARAQLAQSTARLGYTEVRAPLSGVVSLRVAREGEVIRQGDPIVTIIDLDDVWVRAELEESYMNRVVVGQVLPVRLASGDELQGRVSFISPETEFATQRDVNRTKRDIKTFGIKVALANPERRLHSGMTAYVMVPAGVPAPVALPPRGAAPPRAAATEPPPPAADPSPAPRVAAVSAAAPSRPAAPPPAVKIVNARAVRPAPALRASASAAAPAAPKPEPVPAPTPTPVATRPMAPMLPVTRPAPGTTPPSTAVPAPALPPSLAAAPPVTRPPAEEAGSPSSAQTPPAPAMARPAVPALPQTVPPVARPAESGFPRLSLEAISVINGKPVAVINKQKLVTGETISGARVIRILDHQVELEYQGRRFVVGL